MKVLEDIGVGLLFIFTIIGSVMVAIEIHSFLHWLDDKINGRIK